jgi:hypothetical protein
MKKLFLSLALISISLACGRSKEAKLIEIKDDPTLKLYVDQNSVKHVSGNIVRAWVTFAFKHPQKVGPKLVQRAVSYDELDCSKRTLQIIQVIFYFTDGTSQSLSSKSDSSNIASGSPAEFEFNYLCRK